MHMQPSEAKALTWWEYDAMVTEWNAMHTPADAEDTGPVPDADEVERRWARLASKGLVH